MTLALLFKIETLILYPNNTIKIITVVILQDQ
jgi:hypothetical protein